MTRGFGLQQAAAVLCADADTTVNEEVAPDQASRLDDSSDSGVPGQQIQDNMQQTQNTSQERALEMIQGALEAGASAYVTKATHTNKLIETIREVGSG